MASSTAIQTMIYQTFALVPMVQFRTAYLDKVYLTIAQRRMALISFFLPKPFTLPFLCTTKFLWCATRREKSAIWFFWIVWIIIHYHFGWLVSESFFWIVHKRRKWHQVQLSKQWFTKLFSLLIVMLWPGLSSTAAKGQ